jgi:uncharacterized protein YkwD
MSTTLSFFAATLFWTFAAEATPKEPKLTLLPIESNIIMHTNQERARYGLPALAVDHSLMKSARGHAAWMTLSRSLTHTNQPVAENIATGQQSSEEAVGCWMNSSGHRANILNPSYRRIGAAAYRTPEGQIFWCQQFLW